MSFVGKIPISFLVSTCGSNLFKGLGVTPWRLMQNPIRTLYTRDALGLESYENQRERVKTQFSGMSDKFREKMIEFTQPETKQMIFTEDLKNMAHLVEDKPEDLTLIHQMMKRFNQQNRHLRFGTFVFGPVVMRMYHFLNEPNKALEAFMDPDLDIFFDQFTSVQILCDLLYKNGMYKEVLDIGELMKKKQIQGMRYPKNVFVLVFAACYKMNTIESYEHALKTLSEMKEHAVEPLRRCVTFSSFLAIKQNAPQVALEVLSVAQQNNYVTVRNLKVYALAELNRPDDALPILRYSIEFDNPDMNRKHTICPDVIEKMKESVLRLDKKEVTLEFDRIHKAMVETNQISKENLETLLEEEIRAFTPRMLPNDQMYRQNAVDRNFRVGQITNYRPRRNQNFQTQGQNRMRSVLEE